MPHRRSYEIADPDHVTCDQLISAAASRLRSARRLLEVEPIPQVVVYLLHVALECALKARIVRMARCRSVYDLRDRKLMPEQDFKRIFRGVDGHRLGELAQVARLNRLLADCGTKLEERVWERMCHRMRPYSARYGSEAPPLTIARAEFELGAILLTCLEVTQ
jgi:hypothetical protein